MEMKFVAEESVPVNLYRGGLVSIAVENEAHATAVAVRVGGGGGDPPVAHKKTISGGSLPLPLIQTPTLTRAMPTSD